MPGEPSTPRPFANPSVVATYEDWYSTPFGALADELEVQLLIDMLGELPEGASLLEIGCGTGHFGAALTARGYRVTGIDPAPAMLQRARSREPHPLPVAIASGTRLPFADASFDAALLVAVLDFVEDPREVLREALRVARSRVAVLALVSHSILALRRRVAGLRGHPIFSTARFYSRRALLQFARDAMGGGQPVGEIPAAQILVLPPSIAGRFPGLERRLSGRSSRCGGVLGFRMEKEQAEQIEGLS